jgi:probable H4MPT-linked C1 transfer pathway protein
LVAVIGLDVGGANIKMVFLKTTRNLVEHTNTEIYYFPLWKNREKLANHLSNIRRKIKAETKIDGLGLTMTGELSDAYQTKREGVNHILSCAANAFSDSPLFVLTVNGNLVNTAEAKTNPLEVAAANWMATGWLVAKKIDTCIIVDVGSTTTSIIPVVDSHVIAAGKTDLEKLAVGELVYTGSLRTNIAAIVTEIPVKNSATRIASELFATSGDIHLVLGNINEVDYNSETADNRGKKQDEALARLARVVCADIEMLSEKEIIEIARYIYEKQIKQIVKGLEQVYLRVKSLTASKIPVVATGLGKDFLAKIAAQRLLIKEIIDLEKLTPENWVNATPAAGVALMTASRLEGRIIEWKQ